VRATTLLELIDDDITLADRLRYYQMHQHDSFRC
jgi:hypothetical protein